MPEEDRDLLLLYACADLSYDECALALGIPVGTVRSRLHRLRARLRKRLEPISDGRTEHEHRRVPANPRRLDGCSGAERADAGAALRRLETTIASDTQPRARRRYRPQTLLAAALLLGLLGAVPAFSGTGYDRVIDWLTGEPPKEVVENLERMDQGAPPGMAQHPIVGKTGLVYKRQTQYGEVRVWLTPAKGGTGFCAELRGATT